jgi:hypothetical protein
MPVVATIAVDQLPEAERIALLRERIPTIAMRSRSFAESLATQYDNRGRLSVRQWEWVARLINQPRSDEASDAPGFPVPEVGATAVREWLDRAHRNGVLRPAVRYPLPGGAIRFSRPGATSRYIGQPITFVRLGDQYAGALRDGRFLPARDFAVDAAFRGNLTALLVDPFASAVARGHASGNCCFCGRELTDARSVHHGYGPVCAENYGLPWDADRDVARVENLQAAAPIPRAAPAARRPAAPAVAAPAPVEPLPGLDAEDMEFMDNTRSQQ